MAMQLAQASAEEATKRYERAMDRAEAAQLEVTRCQRAEYRHRPDAPGTWYWEAWDCNVEVYKKRVHLYVTPPGGVEVRITGRIAGGWVAVPTNHSDARDDDTQRRPTGADAPSDVVHSS